MAAGSIIIDLLLKTGTFETDTKRAEARLKAFQKQVEDVSHAIGVGIGAAVVTAGAALAGLGVAFNEFANAAGDFKDLEEQTGAAAQDLASLQVAAAVAGLSVADIAANANKLTKNLSGVDDESKAAGAALAALGIPIKDFKNLDPVGQIDALTSAFNGFADGSQKTAVALALFGKQGAAMLSLFKELEAEGGRQIVLTQEQIELADEYGDNQKKLNAQLKQYGQVIATEALPALNALKGVAIDVAKELLGIDDTTKTLANDNFVSKWAEEAALIVAGFVDSLRTAVSEVKSFAASTKAEFAFINVGLAALKPGAFGQLITEGNGPLAAALNERDKLLADAAKTFAENASFNTTKARDALKEQFRLQKIATDLAKSAKEEGGGPPGSKTQLEFNGATKTTGKSERESEAERYLDGLVKQQQQAENLTNVEKALYEIQNNRLKGLTPELEVQILLQANLLDVTKREAEARKAATEVITRASQARNKELEALDAGNDKLRDEIEQMGRSREEQAAYELQKIRVTAAEKEATRAKAEALPHDEHQLDVLDEEIRLLRERETLLGQKQDKAAEIEGQKAAERNADSLRDSTSEALAEGLLDGFRRGESFGDVFVKELKAQFAKAVLQPIIAPIVRAQNDGISQLLGSFTGLFGGNTTDYRGTTLPDSLRGGAATGTNLVQRDMVTLLHKGEAVVPKAYNPAAGGSAGGIQIVMNNTGTIATAREERSGDGARSARKIVIDTVAADLASGTGPTAIAARNRLGTGPGNVARRG